MWALKEREMVGPLCWCTHAHSGYTTIHTLFFEYTTLMTLFWKYRGIGMCASTQRCTPIVVPALIPCVSLCRCTRIWSIEDAEALLHVLLCWCVHQHREAGTHTFTNVSFSLEALLHVLVSWSTSTYRSASLLKHFCPSLLMCACLPLYVDAQKDM